MYSSSSPLYSDSSTEIDFLVCNNLPKFFYRVQYETTNTTFDMENGFFAGDPNFVINDLITLKDRVQLAFTWCSGSASPFINVFSERRHAENWAQAWGKDERRVYQINTAELGDVKVFKLFDLIQYFELKLAGGATQHKEGAYLCLNRIPIEAVDSSVMCFQVRRAA